MRQLLWRHKWQRWIQTGHPDPEIIRCINLNCTTVLLRNLSFLVVAATPNISFVRWLLKCGTTMLVTKVLCVVSCPRCTAGPSIVGSCYIGLHTTANVETTTPNIVGPAMLGVIASIICVQLKECNFLFLWHCRYYDQPEAMEGKFPVSESQVSL